MHFKFKCIHAFNMQLSPRLFLEFSVPGQFIYSWTHIYVGLLMKIVLHCFGLCLSVSLTGSYLPPTEIYFPLELWFPATAYFSRLINKNSCQLYGPSQVSETIYRMISDTEILYLYLYRFHNFPLILTLMHNSSHISQLEAYWLLGEASFVQSVN